MIHAVFALILAATASAQDVERLEQKLKSEPDNISTRVKLAEFQIHEKRFAQAVELLNAYTDQLPPAGFRALAFAYSSLKKYDDEVRVLSIISGKNEENHEWHMLLAQAYLKQAAAVDKANFERHADLLTASIKQLRIVLKIQPKYRPAFDLLLKTFLNQRSNSEARELLIEGIQRFGPRPEFYRELCRIDSNDGFLVQAVSNCTESIKISPRYPDHYVFLIQALFDQKEEIKAEKAATEAARKFPDSEFVQWASGTLFFRKKNFPVAARYFQAAVKADPDSSRSRFSLAQALYESGHEKDALEHFIKACKADRKTVDTFLSAAGRLKQKGDSALGAQYSQAANTCR